MKELSFGFGPEKIKRLKQTWCLFAFLAGIKPASRIEEYESQSKSQQTK
jgi:hypothetical protein